MVLEASRIHNLPVLDSTGARIGTIDQCVFLASEARLYGLQVAKGGVISRFRSVTMPDILALNPQSAIVDTEQVLSNNLKELDEVSRQSGPLIGVTAKTESGKKLGKVFDLLLDSDSGFIVRFYLRSFMHERIIPRQFLVSITPREMVFKDVVDTPMFDQVASAEALPAS